MIFCLQLLDFGFVKKLLPKKKFDLEFISPKYKIVYPNSEDLKKSFKTTPL